MSKSKTNALDALRALIAERQQYDQWISTLESKRDATAEHVFNRVYSDYRSRLDRVVGEIRGHAEGLQQSITALSGRLGEVAKDEEAKRDAITEAELRAAVGEYDFAQWESIQADSKRQLDEIAADRATLENQLAELESIKKLSEVTAPSTEGAASTAPPQPEPANAEQPKPAWQAPMIEPKVTAPSVTEAERTERAEQPPPRKEFSDAGWPARDIVEQAPAAASRPEATRVTPSAAASAQTFASNMDSSLAAPRPSATPVAPPPTPTPPRKKRDTPSARDAQISSGFSKPIRTPADARPEVNKTLKCPECGTANYPTEWYCERCGGELATM